MNLKLKSGSLRGAAELTRWLSANGIAFAGWDADDWALMFLADELAAVYVYSTPARAEATAKIFGRVVAKMRPTVRAVAYHLVARLGNWAQRKALWRSAGCEPVMAQLCSFAPGGAAWKGYQLFLNECARIQEELGMGRRRLGWRSRRSRHGGMRRNIASRPSRRA